MTEIAGYAGLAGFGWLMVFQILLVAGVPLGRLAWKGLHPVLPPHLRLASGVSAVLAATGAVLVAQKMELIAPILPVHWQAPLLWGFLALFVLSFLANLFGAKGGERLHGVPLTLVIAVSCGVLTTT